MAESDISSSASSSLRDRAGTSRACRARSSRRPAAAAALCSTSRAATARSPCASGAANWPISVSPTSTGTVTSVSAVPGPGIVLLATSAEFPSGASTPFPSAVSARLPLLVARGRNSTGVPSARLTESRSRSRLAPAISARSTASRPCWARPSARSAPPLISRTSAWTSPARSALAGMETSAMSARPAMSIAVTVGSHCSAANAATALTRFTVAQRSAMSSR